MLIIGIISGLPDMKYIGFKHQRENKQNSNKKNYGHIITDNGMLNINHKCLYIKVKKNYGEYSNELLLIFCF
jgi:hypothetical protein